MFSYTLVLTLEYSSFVPDAKISVLPVVLTSVCRYLKRSEAGGQKSWWVRIQVGLCTSLLNQSLSQVSHKHPEVFIDEASLELAVNLDLFIEGPILSQGQVLDACCEHISPCLSAGLCVTLIFSFNLLLQPIRRYFVCIYLISQANMYICKSL